MREIANLGYNFCYECSRDLFSFPVDQKYEIRYENDKNVENRPMITAAGSLKHFFMRHPAANSL